MRNKIIIGSRASKLALIYAQRAKNIILKNTNLKKNEILIKKIKTKGDHYKNIRLSEVGGKGLFSSTIEKELQKKKIDIAVHALKDLPADETVNLKTDFFLERNDPREILISKNKLKLKDLKLNSTIGTSSFRREFQIKKIRNDLKCKLIRGNVDTRIKKLNDGIYDAIILSYAGIKSLMLKNVVTEIFSTKKIIPSAGQGIIALQCRKKDNRIISILKKINHVKTYARANAERGVLRVLQGDCQTAVGAHAVIKKNKISIEAELFSLDGKKRFYEKRTSKLKNAKSLGEKVGLILKKKSNNSYKK
tara:strand:- start:6199 stop:7116 length:918 start_codon:yes stop_codon:yes gene_type:complete